MQNPNQRDASNRQQQLLPNQQQQHRQQHAQNQQPALHPSSMQQHQLQQRTTMLYKTATIEVGPGGPNTMIINIGQPRNTAAVLGPNQITAVPTSFIGTRNLLAPLTAGQVDDELRATIQMPSNSVVLIQNNQHQPSTQYSTSSDAPHLIASHSSQLQMHSQQLQHQQTQQPYAPEVSMTAVPNDRRVHNSGHVIHHLSQSGTIIASNSLHNSHSTAQQAPSAGAGVSLANVHHLGSDIQLFEIPMGSGSLNGDITLSDGNLNGRIIRLHESSPVGESSHSSESSSAANPVAMDSATNENHVIYVTDVVPELAQTNNNNNTGGGASGPKSDPAIGGPNATGTNSNGSSSNGASSSNSIISVGHERVVQRRQYRTLDMSAALSTLTSEQAEKLMSDNIEIEHQTSILSIDQTSFSSSPLSLQIDLDMDAADMDNADDDDGDDDADGDDGAYADASNQSAQSAGPANGSNAVHMGGGGGSGSASANGASNGNYMPLLPTHAGSGANGDAVGSLGSGAPGNNNGGGASGGGASGGTSANASSCDQTEFKFFIEELCPVCGDKTSGYHYGLLTCESCKGFFKRTVQNKKVYTCVAERQCHIDKTQRKRCPFCRFQKCLEVGMKLEAVRADRMRGGRNKFGPMYKRDKARKLQIMRQRQLAIQTLRAVEGVNPMDPTGYGQSYHMNIKQEIQIPQISSLTSSSPDSSPSPIAIALGQVNASGVSTVLGGASSAGLNGSNTSSSSAAGGGSGPGSSTSGSSGGGASSGAAGTSSNGPTNSIPSTTSSSAVHQNTPTDSKQWFIANSTTASPHSLSPKPFSYDSGSNPTSTADAGPVTEPLSKKQNWKNSKSLNFPRVSPMIRDFVQSVDDREWQQQLFSLLQSQSYNQCEVDVFELMCKVLDQNLFSQVDWARNTVFFKDLKVDDQMKLLQNSWSDMLVLDHLHQRIHNNLPDETTLHNGQKFDLLGLGLLGVPQLSDVFNALQQKLLELKFDVGDYICMKFLLLLNPDFADVRGITNKKTVLEGYENVQAALLDYTLTCYPTVTDKFSKLISIIPEIHTMAARGEEHLYVKHCAGSAPTQTLLMEMLHAKRK